MMDSGNMYSTLSNKCNKLYISLAFIIRIYEQLALTSVLAMYTVFFTYKYRLPFPTQIFKILPHTNLIDCLLLLGKTTKHLMTEKS